MNGEHDPVVHDPASGGEPIEVPLEFREPPSLVEEIRRFVRVEMSRAAQESGYESFEESNDLEFNDDDDLSSVHELTEDQEMAMMAIARSSRDIEESGDGSKDSGKGVGSGGGNGKGSAAVGSGEFGKADGSGEVGKAKGGVSGGDSGVA